MFLAIYSQLSFNKTVGLATPSTSLHFTPFSHACFLNLNAL
jgi:hypothetical protein